MTALCLGTAASGLATPYDSASRTPLNQIYIQIDPHALHDSLWVDAEDDDVLTRSGAQAMAVAAHEALARIRHLGTLGEGWDGTDVAAPVPTAIQDAMTLITKLANAGSPLRPRIGLESDGTVGFSFFRDGRAIADMTIPGDKTYSYFAQDGGPPASSDDAHIGSPIPRDLLAILSA